MNLPTKVSISPALYKELMSAQDDQNALEQFSRRIVEQGQKQQAALNERLKNTWKKIAAETGIDIENVVWAPDQDKPEVIPMQMRLTDAR